MEDFKVYIVTKKQQEEYRKWNEKHRSYDYGAFASENDINPDYIVNLEEAFKLEKHTGVQINVYDKYVRPSNFKLNEGAEILKKYQIMKDLENEVLK